MLPSTLNDILSVIVESRFYAHLSLNPRLKQKSYDLFQTFFAHPTVDPLTHAP